ncbi:hypothetical protein [Neisseria musculi]|uniref:Uncharacterized protein n=1 Tax=Neisseria musculi TaxID=1815583 RepID=A0A7H1M823_9NEIS|nr:hypothetical protein [Neisseria musculi]QNT57788.1 hypothetical protein H7A79_1042 [Neisseria musculi]
MTKPLSEAERARAAEMKQQWIEAFGDDSVIRELYKVGLIDGWRDVVSVRKLNGNDELAVPPEGNGG